VTFLLVIFCPQTPRIGSNLEFFFSNPSSWPFARNLRFRMRCFVWGLFLLGFTCSWGRSTPPQITALEVAWVKRSIQKEIFPSCPGKTWWHQFWKPGDNGLVSGGFFRRFLVEKFLCSREGQG
jgi:hypothetical protein